MTEPTDAELLEVIREAARGGAIRRDGSTSLRIARAVLAKWGAPQPTQPQAGAVPLTDEQSHALLHRMADESDKWAEGLSYEPTREQVSGWCVAFLMRELPAHGIKGGQHGADT